MRRELKDEMLERQGFGRTTLMKMDLFDRYKKFIDMQPDNSRNRLIEKNEEKN